MHTVSVVATDKAGNMTAKTDSFVIDTTPPVVTLSQSPAGVLLNVPVTVTYTATDTYLATVTALLDGASFATGAIVSAAGPHTATVTATDKAGNSTTQSDTFTLDFTPPVVTITGVANGVTYTAAVAPVVVTITDSVGLASTTVTLNGSPFVSGTAIIANGTYTLFAQGVDKAGNATSDTLQFTIVATQLTLTQSASASFPRVLALLETGCGCPSRQDTSASSFLTAALGGSSQVLQIERTGDDFVTALRTGEYNVLVVLELDGNNWGCGGWSGDEDDWMGEATEAVYAGRAGLVVIRTDPDQDQLLSGVLGADVGGEERGATSVVFGTSPIGPLSNLTLGSDAAEWDLDGATSVATYGTQPRCDIAVVHDTYGNGQSYGFGFDLTRATPVATATTALVRTVAQVTPSAQPSAPLGIATIEIDVTALGGSSTTVVKETLPNPLVALDAIPQATIGSSGRLITWQQLVSPSAPGVFRLLTQLPDQAATYQLSTELDLLQGSASTRIGTYPLTLSTSSNGAGLLAATQALANALPNRGRDSSLRRQILSDLTLVQNRVVRRQDDAEENIENLLDAANAAAQLSTVNPEAMRLSVDGLLAYWEARWSEL